MQQEKKPHQKIRSGSFISLASAQQKDEIKQCPRCQASILKMEDGSCVSLIFIYSKKYLFMNYL